MVEIVRRPARSAVFGNAPRPEPQRAPAPSAPPAPAAPAAHDWAAFFAERVARPVLVLDNGKRVLWANAAFAARFSTQDGVGKPISQWFSDLDGFLESLAIDRPERRGL